MTSRRATRAEGNSREPWTCPTCKAAVSTPYCSVCGECPLRPRDLTLRGFVDQIVQSCTSIDGTLLHSTRCLVTRPGALTLAYLEGRRKPYTLPLQLFLVANLLFFAMESLTGAKVFSTPLDMHLQNQFWSGFAQTLVAHHLEKVPTTLEAYARTFDQAVALNAKSLVVLMVLPFALIPPMVFPRSRRPFVVHLVFSLHLYAFLLLLFSVALAIADGDVLLGGAGLRTESFDHGLSIIEVRACAAYLYLATGTVYGARGSIRILQVVLLVSAVVSIVLGYRLALLPITLYTT